MSNKKQSEKQETLSIRSLVDLSNDVLNNSAFLTNRATSVEEDVRLGRFADEKVAEGADETVKLPHEQLESIRFCLTAIRSNMSLADDALLKIRRLAVGDEVPIAEVN